MRKTFARSALHHLLSLAPGFGAGSCVPILMYHSIDSSGSTISVSPENFRRQMGYFARLGWRSIPLARLADCLEGKSPPPAPGSFVITFDDGFDSVAREAWPAMRHHGFSGTVFLTTDYMGREATWNPETPRGMRIMGWDAARRLAAAGMEFGSHSVTHPFLTQCDAAALGFELSESKRTIERELSVAIDLLCYPYGDFDARVIDAARGAGYRAGTTIFAGNRHSARSTMTLDRVYAVDYEPMSYYRLAGRPGYSLYVALKRENRALVRQIEFQRLSKDPGRRH